MTATPYRGARTLVTGGLGFIGSNLVLRLLSEGAHVTVVDSMIPAYGANLFNLAPVMEEPNLRINFSDIRDPHSLSYLVAGMDVIFSLAGQLSHLDSMTDPLTDLDINCRSQLSLLECCRRVCPTAKIVFASTRQVYGRPRFLPVTEAHPTEPTDVNGVNKLAAEMYYALYDRVYGQPTVNLRLTNTYGPRMDLQSDRKGFTNVFLRQALSGEKIRLFGTGEQRRDFNFVTDVVDALLLAGSTAACRGRAFNLAASRAHSLREFVAVLQRLLTFAVECVPFPPDRQAIDIGDYVGDASAFTALTAWRPKVDLEEGLRETVAFFSANRQHYLVAGAERSGSHPEERSDEGSRRPG